MIGFLENDFLSQDTLTFENAHRFITPQQNE
jgi:hypothetical protein